MVVVEEVRLCVVEEPKAVDVQPYEDQEQKL
jgi:hypothetical protein